MRFGGRLVRSERQGIAHRTVCAHVDHAIGRLGLSAARYPIVLYGPLRLPPILPHDLTLYAWLRDFHTVLAYLLFATFLAHFGGALFHGVIRRDGVFGSMASWR